MIMKFVEAWDENKEKLRDYFKNNIQSEYCDSYHDILCKVITIVINPYLSKIGESNLLVDDIKLVDYGDYQGTLILIFHEDTYEPSTSETYYTSVRYGSCSGCDTLKHIYHYEDDCLPNDEQVDDYMTLSLHLIQKMSYFASTENDSFNTPPRYIVRKRNESDSIYSIDVTILKHKITGKYSFVNLTKGTICPCEFDSIEDAKNDLQKQFEDGKIISFTELE